MVLNEFQEITAENIRVDWVKFLRSKPNKKVTAFIRSKFAEADFYKNTSVGLMKYWAIPAKSIIEVANEIRNRELTTSQRTLKALEAISAHALTTNGEFLFWVRKESLVMDPIETGTDVNAEQEAQAQQEYQNYLETMREVEKRVDDAPVMHASSNEDDDFAALGLDDLEAIETNDAMKTIRQLWGETVLGTRSYEKAFVSWVIGYVIKTGVNFGTVFVLHPSSFEKLVLDVGNGKATNNLIIKERFLKIHAQIANNSSLQDLLFWIDARSAHILDPVRDERITSDHIEAAKTWFSGKPKKSAKAGAEANKADVNDGSAHAGVLDEIERAKQSALFEIQSALDSFTIQYDKSNTRLVAAVQGHEEALQQRNGETKSLIEDLYKESDSALQSINTAFTENEKQFNDTVDEAMKSLGTTVTQGVKTIEEKADKTRAGITADIQSGVDQAIDAVEQGIKLEAAHKLWRQKHLASTIRHYFFLVVFLAWVLGGAYLGFEYRGPIQDFLKAAFGTDENQVAAGTLNLISRALFISVPVLIGIWVARILVRLSMHYLALAEDAAVRGAMIKTFVNMIGNGDVKIEDKDKVEDPTERALMLAAIFRPLPGDHQADVQIPSLADLLGSKVVNKGGS